MTRSEAPPGTSSTAVLFSLWPAVLAVPVLIAGRAGTPGEELGPGPSVGGESETEADAELAGVVAEVAELEGVAVVLLLLLLVAVGRWSLWCHTWYRSNASAPGVVRMFWQVWYICRRMADRDGHGHDGQTRASSGSGIALRAVKARTNSSLK